MKLSIVVPVFNEEEAIESTHKRIGTLVEEMAGEGIIDDYEIIYVDDGSQDNSLRMLKQFSIVSQKVKIISFSRNFGHQRALAAGILHSVGDVVVSIDADLQDPPELIREMVEKSKEGNDIVYAVRKARHVDTVFKRWTARFFYSAMRFMGVDIIYDHADYRLISRKVVNAFKGMKEVNIFLRGMFPYLGFKHDLIYYDRMEREAGETKYPLLKMLAFAWEGITSFSNIPLRIASVMGVAISFLSVLLGAWAFYTKLKGDTVPGWASIVIPMFLIGGLNILFLGLIGEYIGKIYLEVKRRPPFIIRESYNLICDEHQQDSF